ncbi:hypothetical protein ARAF_3061 [Arsenophonus endosymbiont of Aleurodicus floccissimus]|nr:hypothetical protein ARAF_3061 [Arsenophonus endosymbiont of Aleurodicus floccissimus]
MALEIIPFLVNAFYHLGCLIGKKAGDMAGACDELRCWKYN